MFTLIIQSDLQYKTFKNFLNKLNNYFRQLSFLCQDIIIFHIQDLNYQMFLQSNPALFIVGLFVQMCIDLIQQAGAELCQAQEKLGLAKTDLPVVVFHLL